MVGVVVAAVSVLGALAVTVLSLFIAVADIGCCCCRC